MKSLLLLALTLFTGSLYAQTTAQDFTKTDCDGTEHHLFAELDSGYVVVLEYVMLDCQPCVDAANGIKPIIQQYETSHPGRVRLYSIGYNDAYNCTQMTSWRTSNGFTHPVFTEGWSDINYYGGMGMPTIVVVGGSAHNIYYNNHQGYSSAENTKIQTAISQALTGAAGVEAVRNETSMKVSMNAMAEQLNINFSSANVDRIIISDLSGRQVLVQQIATGTQMLDVSLAGLTKGMYVISALNDGQVVATSKLVK